MKYQKHIRIYFDFSRFIHLFYYDYNIKILYLQELLITNLIFLALFLTFLRIIT